MKNQFKEKSNGIYISKKGVEYALQAVKNPSYKDCIDNIIYDTKKFAGYKLKTCRGFSCVSKKNYDKIIKSGFNVKKMNDNNVIISLKNNNINKAFAISCLLNNKAEGSIIYNNNNITVGFCLKNHAIKKFIKGCIYNHKCNYNGKKGDISINGIKLKTEKIVDTVLDNIINN